MGMSNDFEEAIKFGATSVRIGQCFLEKGSDNIIKYDQIFLI